MTTKYTVVYVEIDIPYCSRTYGSAPCTASIPTTGSRKCFNTKGTCQDRPNFGNSTVTLRFGLDNGNLDDNIECIASLRSVSHTPSVISLGSGLGQRATVSCVFADHKHSDAGQGFDKYLADRTYDPYKQGTFFGKFRARHPYLKGVPLRVIKGYKGQTLAEMNTYHYVIESFDGPTPKGEYQLTAKDVLKLADDDRSKAPRLSQGSLSAGITNVATTLVLSPSGIGNAEYPLSGTAAIAGKEIVTFTRVADTLTIVRGTNGTTAEAHNAGDRVQLCLLYTAQSPADIINDLFVAYAGIPASYIDLPTWTDEVDSYLQRVYTTVIAEPTGVRQLVAELCEQAALAVWYDELHTTIRLQVLRPVPVNATVLTEDVLLERTLNVKDMPERRVSEIWTYFGMRNPLEDIEEPRNYRSALLSVDLQSASDYGSSQVAVVYSRWIPAFGKTTAARLNQLVMSRFRNPPRKFSFEVFATNNPGLVAGGGFKIQAHCLQQDTGEYDTANIQVTRYNALMDRIQIEAEEVLNYSFVVTDGDVSDPNTRVIVIDSNVNNVNLRSIHDTLFSAITSPATTTVRCIINDGVTVGSSSPSTPAFDVGSWPALTTVELIVNGNIVGSGGVAGYGLGNGYAGGTALYTRYAISLDNQGNVWGGGGGGGGGRYFTTYLSAGRGAGVVTTSPATDGIGGTGSAVFGTAPSDAFSGAGGNAGLAGAAGKYVYQQQVGPALVTVTGATTGGAAGSAIDGVSYVTVVTAGDRRGSEIN